MKRILYKDLIKWKHDNRRKPLLLQGARQVGKTYLINEFGKNEYSAYVYLNFEQNPNLLSLFANDLSPQKIIENIALYIGEKINHHDTLIFFDEIQIAPKVLTGLKYFYEQAPEYHIIAAGSLLGVSIGKQSSFPVGKVNFLNMHPMSFIEYLWAIKEALLAEKLQTLNKIENLADLLHEKLLRHLKMYLYLGGMPEVLQDYIDNGDIKSARKIQNEILEAYKRDFSKYSSEAQAIKTTQVWYSVPFQLAKENKKFKYGNVKKNSRAAIYEETIEWLKNAGLINVVYNIKTPKLPIAGYTDFSKFKIYLLDSGLLGAMLNLTSEIIVKPNELFSEYNGAFIENFIASELVSSGIKNLYYWTSKSDAEVDFVFQKENKIFPLEVKSGLSKNKKSLRSYESKYKPQFIFRSSPRNFIQDKNFINLPLYSCFKLTDNEWLNNLTTK